MTQASDCSHLSPSDDRLFISVKMSFSNPCKYMPMSSTSREQTIGHVNNIPTMQLFTGIPKNTQSKSYMLSLTECVWDFQNNALTCTIVADCHAPGKKKHNRNMNM